MDYDVSAVALSVPPAEASLTTYRPAMLVRNNGRYPATVTGSLSAYMSGLRVYHSAISSSPIAPGETGLALALDDWTPDTQGWYMWMGYATCYRDQNEPNNNLAPITIHVGPEPPTPPPAVPDHHEQHQHGGSDVLDVDDLPGLLSDAQTPLPHASTHQAAGADQLNVSGLAGVLGEPQLPTDHGNEHHSTDFASSDELTNHANANSAHTAATNLEQVAHKGQANGYPSLDTGALVPVAQLALNMEPGGSPSNHFLALDQTWRIPAPTQAIPEMTRHVSYFDAFLVTLIGGTVELLHDWSPSAAGPCRVECVALVETNATVLSTNLWGELYFEATINGQPTQVTSSGFSIPLLPGVLAANTRIVVPVRAIFNVPAGQSLVDVVLHADALSSEFNARAMSFSRITYPGLE